MTQVTAARGMYNDIDSVNKLRFNTPRSTAPVQRRYQWFDER